MGRSDDSTVKSTLFRIDDTDREAGR